MFIANQPHYIDNNSTLYHKLTFIYTDIISTSTQPISKGNFLKYISFSQIIIPFISLTNIYIYIYIYIYIHTYTHHKEPFYIHPVHSLVVIRKLSSRNAKFPGSSGQEVRVTHALKKEPSLCKGEIQPHVSLLHQKHRTDALSCGHLQQTYS